MWLSLSGNRSPTFMADYVRNVIKPSLQTIEGVGEVFIGGYRQRSIRVWFDAARLEAQGLTVQDVNRAIENEHLEVPAGRIETPEREMNVRAEGEAINVEAFRQIVVASRQGLARPAQGRGRGRGRPRGPAPPGPQRRRALDRVRHPQAARSQRGRGRRPGQGQARGPPARPAGGNDDRRPLRQHDRSSSTPSTRSCSRWSWPRCSPASCAGCSSARGRAR